MLRSPLESLGRHRLATVGVVMALAASMWLMAALGASVVQIQAGAVAWWEQFVPVVYLEEGVDEAEVAYLREEIEEWSAVASVTVETADEFVDRLKAEFGTEEVEAMGVEASMMPTALIVEPRVWQIGEAELVARLEAMEVRRSVMDVEAPEPGVLSWMESGRSLLIGAVVAVVVVAGASLVGMVGLLRNIQHRHRRENHLLEVFGASPGALRRPTVIRGLALGTAGGLMAALGFLPWALALDGFFVAIVGVGAMPATVSAIWALGLIAAGVVVGLVAGWGCSRSPKKGRTQGMESILEWEQEPL